MGNTAAGHLGHLYHWDSTDGETLYFLPQLLFCQAKKAEEEAAAKAAIEKKAAAEAQVRRLCTSGYRTAPAKGSLVWCERESFRRSGVALVSRRSLMTFPSTVGFPGRVLPQAI